MPESHRIPRRLRGLPGQTALVTGASGAFGSATMTLLRHLGVTAVGLDHKPAPGVIQCDITDEDQVTSAINEALPQLGNRVNLLIHYAGIGPAVDIGAMPEAGAQQSFDVNVLGAWRVTAAALPALLDSRGRAIFTASLLSGISLPFAGAYTVSKRALTAYADMLRVEYGTHLDVTTVYPGYVDTAIHERSRAAGVSLDGLVPAEEVRDTVRAVLRAAAARRPPRDVASTGLGQAGLRVSRHMPRAVERLVGLQVAALAHTAHFGDAPLAKGLNQRHHDARQPTAR